jgi:flagellar biogenesis protein FliO
VKRGAAAILIGIAMLLSFAGTVTAQDGPAALKVADDKLEALPISAGNPNSSGTDAKTMTPPGTFDVTRVMLATLGVIALIFLMRAVIRKIFPSTAVHRGTNAVKVLSRCTISPRQHLLVVQFGKRLLLVGDSGTSLNSLCEIADPDEAANVVAQTREESISVAKRFDSLFGRARKDFDPSGAAPETETFDNSVELRRDDPAIAQTQKELADLHDKVREVAERIGRA